jgi:hypothetical protein
VPDVVVGRTDHRGDVRLILPQHRPAVVVGVRVGAGVGVDQIRVVGHEHQTDAHIALIDGGHAVDGRDDRGLPGSHRAAVERGVLARRGDGRAVRLERPAAVALRVPDFRHRKLAGGVAGELVEGHTQVVVLVIDGRSDSHRPWSRGR